MFGSTAEQWREICEQLTLLNGVEHIEVFPDDDEVIVHVWASRCEAVDAVFALAFPPRATE
jgi:hypothetical protein